MINKSASIQHEQGNKQCGKAIVMGASIAGLWTARALSDYFEEVVVLDRDQLPEGPEYRSGAPQARQYHTLLESGLRQMRKWFPGLEDELIAAGAIPYDPIGDLNLRVGDYWFPRFPSDSKLLSCSRLLLESRIRKRLRQNACIHFVEGVEAVGLQSDAAKQRVSGVRVRNRHAGSNQTEAESFYEGDLVVDALGRRSQTPQWLVEIGYSAPEENEVDSFLGYVTRRYKRKPNTPIMLLLATPPDHPYGALVFPEENDTMVVFIGGVNRRYPPTDPQEFDRFAHILGPEFEEALKDAEPVSQPYGYRGTANRWRHYEQLKHWPERFVVLGDAFCGFNPVYGQGMSVAALSAAALADRIRHSNGHLDGIAKPTLKEIGRITQSAWLLATSSDLQWPDTQGGKVGNSPLDRFGRWYIGKLLETTFVDKKVRVTLVDVNQLIKPGTAFFAPGIFLRVMKHALLKKRQG